MTALEGSKISYSYWLEESRCVVLVGAVDLGLLCGCNYVGVEIPLDELPTSLWGGSGVL